MAEDIEIIDEFSAGNVSFEIGKSYVIIVRKNWEIIAARPVFNWLHMKNIINKLQEDSVYRKKFLETYYVQSKRHERKETLSNKELS